MDSLSCGIPDRFQKASRLPLTIHATSPSSVTFSAKSRSRFRETAVNHASSEVDALRQQIEALTEENEHLKLLVAKYRSMHFGQKAESQAQLGQLDLALAYDPLAIKLAESIKPTPAANDAAVEKRARKRKPFLETLPRETVMHLPQATDCPACGGQFKPLGEDVSEMLEYVPASFKVVRHVRPKLACAHCDHIAQADAPSRPIPRGIAGPALLAHMLVGKFCDHLPLYRQSAIYARSGLDLDRTLLAEWVGHCHELLSPLVETIRRYVLGGAKVHADDTPLPVLSPGKGRTKTARLWTYVRDDRPAGSDDPPAVWFAYSEDRKGHHLRDHLKSFKGALQADAYAGFNALYETGDIQEAACWAHVRRKFVDVYRANGAPIAAEVIARIAMLYSIETQIRGQLPAERRTVRQAEARPRLHELRDWLESQNQRVSRKSGIAEAIGYALNQWSALMYYTTDGRVEIDNNAAERALRSVATGRSLCTSFRNVSKHWELSLNIVTTRTMFPCQRSRNSVAAQIACANLPWSIRHHLLGRQNPVVDQSPNYMIGDVKHFRCLGHR
jgi:transposase